jgi:hypothetical protein
MMIASLLFAMTVSSARRRCLSSSMSWDEFDGMASGGASKRNFRFQAREAAAILSPFFGLSRGRERRRIRIKLSG